MLEFLKIVVNAISSWPKDPAQAMRLAIGYWMVQLVRNSPEPTARLTDLSRSTPTPDKRHAS